MYDVAGAELHPFEGGRRAVQHSRREPGGCPRRAAGCWRRAGAPQRRGSGAARGSGPGRALGRGAEAAWTYACAFPVVVPAL
eukprot:8585572-Alexandrium_andersonii.AAC.1